jgi:acetyl esterase
MGDDTAASAGADLDPEIRAFVRRMGEAFGAYPPLDTLPLAEARRVAEAVRAPMAAGGPQMAEVREIEIPGPTRPVRVRLYDPGPAGLKPAMIYMHGGGWTMFSLDTHDRLMREYAARAGIVVAGVDYALSPEARFPQALNEVIAAVHHLQRNAAEFGLDGERLALGGDSAGANLATSAACALGQAGQGAPLRALLLNYGVFTADLASASHDRYGGPAYMLTTEEMALFWERYLTSPAERADPRAAPLLADLRGLPPAFLAIPECDVLHDDSLAMAEALRRDGVAVEARVYAGATHSFLEAVSMAEVAGRAFAESSAWLKDRLHGEAAAGRPAAR